MYVGVTSVKTKRAEIMVFPIGIDYTMTKAKVLTCLI